MNRNINFHPCSCSFRLFSKPYDDDYESNFRSQSFSQDSLNSSFSSRSSLPSYISTLIPSSTTIHQECITTFKHNTSHVLSLTLTGNHLFSGSSTHIHFWPSHPTATSLEFASIPCKSAVKSLQILNDNILMSAHQDHKIRIWNINKLKVVATLPTLKDRLKMIFFAKKVPQHKRLTGIHQNQGRSQVADSTPYHFDAVSSLALSKDKTLIYSGSWDRTFKVWRSSDFKCLESVTKAHDDAINTLVVSNEGFIYTGSADKKIKVWRNNQRVRKHDLIDTLEHHKSAVNALAYDDNLSVLISGACSGVLIASERNISNEGDGRHMVIVGALLGHRKAILCVKIVGELVCSGSADKTVRLWRRTEGKSYSCLGVLEGHNGPVKCLAAADERDHGDDDGQGYMVYSGSLDGEKYGKFGFLSPWLTDVKGIESLR